jgi:hypothetical protein
MKKQPPMETIGFRLGASHIALLARGAAAYGISVHEYARGLLIEALEDAERDRLGNVVAELQSDLARHRDEFAAAVLALLLAVGDPGGFSEDEARAWVAQNLDR